MATTQQNWAEIDEDDHDEEPTEESPAATTEENKEGTSRPAYSKKPIEKQIEKFPTQPELITSIKEREDPFVQLYICKANYNAQIKDVLEALKERDIEHGFIQQIKDGLFVIDFESHDKAINFIKQTPKILDRPYFVKISNYNKDYTGWHVEGQKPNNPKGMYKKNFDNNRPPRTGKPYDNRKEKYNHHEEEGVEGEGAAEEIARPFSQNYEGKSNRYEGFNKDKKESTISRGTEGGEEQKEGAPQTTSEPERHFGSHTGGDDAPPPGVNVHKKREYNNNNPNKYHKRPEDSQPEDPNKPKEEYKPKGFSKSTAHKKSEDHESKTSNIFGEAQLVIPKDIVGQVHTVAPVNIAQDLPIATHVTPVVAPTEPAPKTVVVETKVTAPAPAQKEEAKTETKKSAPTNTRDEPKSTQASNQQYETQKENNKPKQEEAAPPADEWITVPKDSKQRKN